MNVFDWIFIAVLVVGLVLGLLKGFLKPLLSAIGFIVVAFGASLLAPVVQGWFENVEMGDSIRSLLAIVLSAGGLIIIWVVVALILRKVITHRKGMGAINRIIGAVIGIAIVYLVFAIIIAFVVGPLGNILFNIKDKFGADVEASWIRQHIYTDKANFFGNWIIGSMVEKLLSNFQGQDSEALAGIAQIFMVSLA